METPVRILSVDDHPLFREGICTVLRNQPDMLLVAEAANGGQALELYREHRPDIVLIDVRLPDMSGVEAMTAILAEAAGERIVMLSNFEGDVEIQRALNAGAHGVVLKSEPPRKLVEAVRQVHSGKKSVPPIVAAAIA